MLCSLYICCIFTFYIEQNVMFYLNWIIKLSEIESRFYCGNICNSPRAAAMAYVVGNFISVHLAIENSWVLQKAKQNILLRRKINQFSIRYISRRGFYLCCVVYILFYNSHLRYKCRNISYYNTRWEDYQTRS